nr:MAG TPA: outer membrane lipoprotein [Bacteriophage sp.]
MIRLQRKSSLISLIVRWNRKMESFLPAISFLFP